jgi:hypothetical protein
VRQLVAVSTAFKRHARVATGGLCAATLAFGGFVATAHGAHASESSDRAQITALQKRIATQGEKVASLVGRMNEVQVRLSVLDQQIARDRDLLAADARAEAQAMAGVRRVAVDAYKTGDALNSPLSMFTDSSNVNSALVQNHYLGVVNGIYNDAITKLETDQEHTRADRKTLESEQSKARDTLAQLTRARRATNDAIAADEATLTRVHGDLSALIAADDEARRQAKERALAIEHAIEIAAKPPLPPPPALTSVTPPPPTGTRPPPVSANGYSNPLRDVNGLGPERIDQGVDYTGFGPLYPIGDGVVLSTVGSGWPNGTFIAYQLTAGPAKGLVVYAAEDIEPNVSPGDTVTSSTVLGHMFAGPDGIEMGWADANAIPNTMARTYDQYHGGNSTAFGANFSQLLERLGAPGGVPQNDPPTGSLPPQWPSW